MTDNSENKFKLDKSLSLWNVITLGLIAFGYVYSIAVFQQHSLDFEIETKDDLVKIESRVEKLESKSENIVRLEEQVKFIRKEIHEINIKLTKILNGKYKK